MKLKKSIKNHIKQNKRKIFIIILSFFFFFFLTNCKNTFNSNIKQNVFNNHTKQPYYGEINNIFFHTLIVYPEKAFDGDKYTNYLDAWFITVDEFQKVLKNLYEDNYVLVDIKSIYSFNKKNGKTSIEEKTLELAPGKKPLILSIDDVNYYHHTKINGLAHRLILDKDNEIASLSVDTNGCTHIKKDEDIIPIMEEFIKKHPDFSHQGARGIIAITGYRGILGYNTHRRKHPKEFAVEKEQAVKIAKHLKKIGWVFASHSYKHIHSYKCTYNEFKYDTDLWEKEVGSLIGNVDIFIYPYGETVGKNSAKLKYLQKKGFRIFMGVEPQSKMIVYNNNIFIQRIPIDGHFLRGRYGSQKSVFESTASVPPDPFRKRI